LAARIGCTIVAALLAVIAFLGGGPTPASLFNPFGILFLSLAALIWFGWEMILGGYTSGGLDGEGAPLPLLARFGPVFIKGVTSLMKPNHRHPSDSTMGGPSTPA